MTEPTDFRAGLRAQLVAAGRRRVRRRRALRATTVVASAAVAVLAATLLVGSGTEPAAAGVDVVVADGIATIRLVDLEHRPELIEREVRAVGLDIDVVAVPVGPSNVGRFVGDIGDLAPGEITPVEGRRGSFAGFEVAVDWPGVLELQVGRPAREGESYALFSDAYLPGEPLSCEGVWGLDATTAASRVAGTGLEGEFQPFADGVGLAPVPLQAVASSPYSAWLVSDAVALSPDRVVLTLTVDGRPPFAEPLSSERGACRE